MPRDSSGNASVNRSLAVTGQTVLAEQVNVPFADIQSMLNLVLWRDGISPWTGTQNANGFRITNVGAGSSDGDAVTVSQLQDALSNLRTVPAGAVVPLRTKTAPAGWLLEDGKTIGNAASGATGRANADTSDLFVHLWTQFTNVELAIQDSAGLASTRGASAAADYAANKRMPLFDSRTRFPRASDGGMGYDVGLTVGASQADALKSHIHTATTAPAGAQSLTSTISTGTGGNRITGGAANPIGTDTTSISPVLDHVHTVTVNATGDALETRPRSSVYLFCIKL